MPKQTAATADATAAPVTPPPTLAAPPTNPVLLLEGGGVTPSSPIARAPAAEDGAGVSPGGNGIVGPDATGAVETVGAAGAADPKTTPNEEGIGAVVGPAATGLAEDATGPASTKPPGGIVMEGVAGATEAATGITEAETTGAGETKGAGVAVAVAGAGKRWKGGREGGHDDRTNGNEEGHGRQGTRQTAAVMVKVGRIDCSRLPPARYAHAALFLSLLYVFVSLGAICLRVAAHPPAASLPGASVAGAAAVGAVVGAGDKGTALDVAVAAGVEPMVPSTVLSTVPAALGAGVPSTVPVGLGAGVPSTTPVALGTGVPGAAEASMSMLTSVPQKRSTRKAPRFACPWYPKSLSIPSAQLSVKTNNDEKAARLGVETK